MKSILILFLFFTFTSGYTQEMGLNIMMMSGKPIVKEQLRQAKSIKDINPGFPASWISEYIAVDVVIANEDSELTLSGVDDKLNEAQLALIYSAKVGADITVNVKYKQANAMNDHATKNMIFTYTVVPDVEAKYIGGHDAMVAYLQERVSADQSEEELKEVELLVVEFTIDGTGNPKDVHVSQSTEEKNIDNLFLKAIENMPTWQPASNADGTKVSQTFELNIGSMIGC